MGTPAKTKQVTHAPTNAAAPLVPSFLRVLDSRKETPDIFTLTLQPKRAYTFLPGQFNMLYAFGVGEAAISISGDPADNGRIVHTIRAVGSVTHALAKLRPGDQVGVRGPFGSPWPLAAARKKDVIIVSGGIGLAPLRPFIYHILRSRRQFGRVVVLHGVRLPSDMLFKDDLDRWSNQTDVGLQVAVSQGNALWRGHVGVVTSLLPLVEFDSKRAVAVMCGPEVMMRFAVRELSKRGVSGERVYVSLERNMQCAVGFCGHCQLGPSFVCMNGPVFRYDQISRFFDIREA